jgi:hypothetical protein
MGFVRTAELDKVMIEESPDDALEVAAFGSTRFPTLNLMQCPGE